MPHNNQTANKGRIYERQAYPNGTYRKVVQVAGLVDADIRWFSHGVAGVATIAVYSTTESEKPFLDAADETDVRWDDEAPLGGVFDALPADAAGSGRLRFSPSPGFYALLFVMVVSAPLTDFEAFLRGQGRAG